MKEGSEPPAVWKVQKALLQKFVPELRDGKRVFSATNSVSGQSFTLALLPGCSGSARLLVSWPPPAGEEAAFLPRQS